MISNNKISYTHYKYKFSSAFKDVKDSYDDIDLPYVNVPGSKRKVLFVLDYVPTEDLKSKRLLRGTTGDILDAIESVAITFFCKKLKLEPFSWTACSFNAFRTAGKSKEFYAAAQLEFAARINTLILKYRPTTVVIFGDKASRYLMVEQYKLSDGKMVPWHGAPTPITIKDKHNEHTCDFVANLSLNPINTGSNPAAALIGYMARRFVPALVGYNPYQIDVDAINKHKSILIDTIPKFNKMLDMLVQQPVVSIDTETRNLNKVTNKLLTIQFAKCVNFGYFLPIYHKDTPFTSKELQFIVTRLRAFFEGHNKNRYHIYVNSLFDLNVERTALKTRYMANSLWDVFSGEYAIDENQKFLDAVTGEYYYSLGNIAGQYGYTGYMTAEFGKQHRGSMETVDLDAPGFIKYGTLDVVVPFAIHEKQIQLGEDIGHVKYKSVVMEQCSDLLHGFSKMSTTGSKLDVDYLFSLATPNSPIEKVVKEMEENLLATPAAKKANQIISRNKGIPTKSLFGSTNSMVMSLRKAEHKKILFFDVLKLKPIEIGKSGIGKLDKTFQKTYEDVPEVSMYTQLEKAKKLKNAFVKSFIKLLGTSEDLKSDHCIRPNYHYLKVITGRTSASDPNLQQVPNHSELAKHIKRLFIAPEGYMYIKVDYRVHEVRGWGLISFDKGIAELFIGAKKLRDLYRVKPSPELKARLKSETDVHIMNAAYFFGVAIDKVDKELRNNVKGIIFGLIYQMSMNTLAANLKRTLEFTLKLVANFNKRFPKGMKWIETAKSVSRKKLFYENPLGFRRHLWGLALPDSLPFAKRSHATMIRQSVNSPIQGMCAQLVAIGIRLLDTSIYNIWVEEKRVVDIRICNSVHDSVENCVAYENILEGIFLIEDALTTKVREVASKRHGFNFVVDVEIDTDVGSTMSTCQAWDTSIAELERIMYESLVMQRDELKYNVDVLAVMEDIFVRQLHLKTSPLWMRKQAKNIGYVFDKSKYVTVKQKKLKTTKDAANA